MEVTAQPPLVARFEALAAADLTEFRQFFRRLYKTFPEQAAEACLWHIASHGLDPAAKSMAFWLGIDSTYVTVLLDLNTLPAEVAAKTMPIVRDIDPQFLVKFAKATAALTAPPVILRALGLLPALVDYSGVISWLRALAQHSDVRVRSRSAKLLCDLRPSKGNIERQLQSRDARVRAGAVEALWHIKGDIALEDVRALLRTGANDPHHRVLANALVGLHRLGESDALSRMEVLCKHKDHLFRAAAAWAVGFVKDTAAIPAMEALLADNSLVVRKRASGTLYILKSLLPAAVEEKEPAAATAPEPLLEPVAEPLLEPIAAETPVPEPALEPLLEPVSEEMPVPAPKDGPRMFLFS